MMKKNHRPCVKLNSDAPTRETVVKGVVGWMDGWMIERMGALGSCFTQLNVDG